MPCLNRKCFLENCAYNLAINNFFSGIITIYQANMHDMLGAFITIGLGVLLIAGVRKKDASILFSFLIMESIVLAFDVLEIVLRVESLMEEPIYNFSVFDGMVFLGLVVSWASMIAVFMLYEDFSKPLKETCDNDCKENNEIETSKTGVV